MECRSMKDSSETCKQSAAKAQLEANQISYPWDDLIERFTRHFLKGIAVLV